MRQNGWIQGAETVESLAWRFEVGFANNVGSLLHINYIVLVRHIFARSKILDGETKQKRIAQVWELLKKRQGIGLGNGSIEL
jgi:hypothetical protein